MPPPPLVGRFIERILRGIHFAFNAARRWGSVTFLKRGSAHSPNTVRHDVNGDAVRQRRNDVLNIQRSLLPPRS